MTSFRIDRHRFNHKEVMKLAEVEPRYSNWPVVYTLNNNSHIYVGESLNVSARMRQHLESKAKSGLNVLRVVFDQTFNKSVCLDLESYLIRLLAGDGQYSVLNRNEGITDSDYFNRADYRQTFEEIFAELSREGVFSRSLPEIENSDLFKLSPYKSLNPDQAFAIEEVLEGLFADIESHEENPIVIQGDPGTGKTIVGIYLMKLLRDIATTPSNEAADGDSLFSEFFLEGYGELLQDSRLGLVVPQQSLRKSIKAVFKKTPELNPGMVLSAFDVGKSETPFDLLIVDETHRLNQRANQASGPLNKQFIEINERLFGKDDSSYTQLDWIRAQSKHNLFLVDSAQSVRPADLPLKTQEDLAKEARRTGGHYVLTSQMRVRGGADYIDYVRRVLSNSPPEPRSFQGYDLRFFDDLTTMRSEIVKRDEDVGLSRLVAGYAWPWKSKNDPSAFDIESDGCRLQWNRTATDWINSPGSLNEVGSIHTVQGYDLNYAGVIFGPDLVFDESTGTLRFDREKYFDAKGKENNPKRGFIYSDGDLLQFVGNIYSVLMTRGIRGSYVYAVNAPLRKYLKRYFSRPD